MKLPSLWQQGWQRWLDRRIPRQREFVLNQRRIFIFLSRYGFMVALVLLALFVGGLNYGNNLLLGVCFLLSSLMVVTIHHTYANLSGLKVLAVGTQPGFAGETAGFHIRLESRPGRCYESLELFWEDSRRVVDTVAGSESLSFFLSAPRRGWHRPPRLKITTVYPLGLLRAWTWLDLDLTALVYPRPIESDAMPCGGGKDGEGQVQHNPGPEDFDGFRKYQPGDALAHVSWPHLARGQGLQTKLFVTETAGTDILDWQYFAGMDSEGRLSRLCWWVVKLARENRIYGLRLPGLEIPLGSGAQHREQCLEALALYEWRG